MTKILIDEATVKLVLEVLEQYTGVFSSVSDPVAWISVVDAGKPAREAITALREARQQQHPEEFKCPLCYDDPANIKQPAQQEPVAWPVEEQPDGSVIPVYPSEMTAEQLQRYTTPPTQRTWVGLDFGNQPVLFNQTPSSNKCGVHPQGEKSMTKKEALQTIKLLSALESWAFSQQSRLPDYLVEDIQRSMQVLERIVLEKNT